MADFPLRHHFQDPSRSRDLTTDVAHVYSKFNAQVARELG